MKLKDELSRRGINMYGMQNETVFKIILDNVCNGHELILHILDGLVKKISNDECSECFGNRSDSQIEVDLCPMFKRYRNPKKFARNKMRLVHDLIEVQNERGDDKNIKKIFKHPVIEILILKKWEGKKLWYYSSVRLFLLFVLLFTFYVRLQILESQEFNTYSAKIFDNKSFNVTVRIAELNTYKLDDNTDITAQVLESNESKNDNSKISDFTNNSFTANLLGSNNTSSLTAQFIKFYDNGTFAAKILEFNGNHTITVPWLKFFKNNMENFVIYAIFMVAIFISQVFAVILDLVVNAEDSKIRNHNLVMHLGNMFYLFLGNFLCFWSGFDDSFLLKITLWLIWIYLTVSEIGQLSVLVFKPAAKGSENLTTFLQKIIRKRYWRDPENYLEILLLISVPLAILVKDWELMQPASGEERNSTIWNFRAACRGFIAMGIFAAWTELVIKMGNVSHSVVGDFIKMFYNIIKNKLFSYMQVCLLLITAFTLAFWVILEGQTEEDANFSSGFWFSQVLTTTMSTGEFNTAEFYKAFQGNGLTRVFAMMFLVGLICLSTITMINLLVAAIINDYNLMKDEVDEENLYFIAEYIIDIEKHQRVLERRLYHLLPDCILKLKDMIPKLILKRLLPSSDERRSFTLLYCPHFICKCDLERLPIPRPGSFRYNPEKEANERNLLLHKLLRIRGGNKGLCEYHKEKKAEDEYSGKK